MKKTVITIILLALLGCADSNKQPDMSAPTDAQTETDAKGDESVGSAIVFHPLTDGKSTEPYGMIPLPANWRINANAGPAIESPDGVKVYNFPIKFYVYTEDPYFGQLYRQSGQPFRRPVPIEDVVEQDLASVASRENAKLIGYSKIKKVAEADRNYDALLFKVAPMQQWFDALVSEWEDAKGNPFLIIVHQSVSSGNNMTNWSYYCQAMEAPKPLYESAKKTLIYGLAHTHYNPKNVEAYNREEARKANLSMAAHQQRMTAMQQQFDASQRAFESKRDAINTAITQGYKDREAASDRQHNRFLNYLKDEETVSANGSRYQVESGARQYWINENGQYIGSDNPNYDPNRNQGNINHTWTNAEIEN